MNRNPENASKQKGFGPDNPVAQVLGQRQVSRENMQTMLELLQPKLQYLLEFGSNYNNNIIYDMLKIID